MVFNSSVVRKVLALAVASCAVAVGTIGRADASTPAPRALVRAYVTPAHGVSAPTKLRPGIVETRNTGAGDIMVVRATRFGIARLVHDFAAAGPGPMLRDFVVVDVMTAHRGVYARLARGTYYLVDIDVDTITAAQVHTTVVSGALVNAELPTAASISVSSDRVLHAARQASSPGWLRLHNGTGQLWETGLARVPAATSETAVRQFLARPSLDGLFTVAGLPVFVGTTGPHQNSWVSFGGRTGRWIVFSIPLTGRLPRLTPATVALINVV